MTGMSRDLMSYIIDEVFEGWVENTQEIEEIYAAIKRHEALSASPAGVKTDRQQDIEDIHKLAAMVGATFKPYERAGVGVETYTETQVSVVRDEDGEVLRRVMFRVPAALKGDKQ